MSHRDIIRRAMSILGKRGRAANTPAQIAAARGNGKKGGRPRKKK